MTDFKYETMFPLGPDTTDYRLISKEHVRVREFEGNEVLLVEPQALNILAAEIDIPVISGIMKVEKSVKTKVTVSAITVFSKTFC